jgi:hypothetical protein
MNSHSLTRRQFTTALGCGIGAMAAGASARSQAADDKGPVAFFFVSDTHYFAEKDAPGELAAKSADVTSQLIATLNRLPGEALPKEVGGGRVQSVQAVIHGGDVIDSGDKRGGPHEKMQRTEWDAFAKDYGLTGKEGALKYPVYEIYGNHDGPQGEGLAIDALRERNKTRHGVKAVSESGLHYAWDVGPVHFVNLGIVVSGVKDIGRRRRYNGADSLGFLIEDLEANVGRSGRPVVLTHHIDIARHTSACDLSMPFASREWDSCDVAAFYEAISPYNVVADLYGHTHARQVHTWDGQTMRAESGISVFNVDNSSHFNDKVQSFFYFEIRPDELVAREYRSTDRWQSGSWSPEVWRRKIG